MRQDSGPISSAWSGIMSGEHFRPSLLPFLCCLLNITRRERQVYQTSFGRSAHSDGGDMKCKWSFYTTTGTNSARCQNGAGSRTIGPSSCLSVHPALIHPESVPLISNSCPIGHQGGKQGRHWAVSFKRKSEIQESISYQAETRYLAGRAGPVGILSSTEPGCLSPEHLSVSLPSSC